MSLEERLSVIRQQIDRQISLREVAVSPGNLRFLMGVVDRVVKIQKCAYPSIQVSHLDHLVKEMESGEVT